MWDGDLNAVVAVADIVASDPSRGGRDKEVAGPEWMVIKPWLKGIGGCRSNCW